MELPCIVTDINGSNEIIIENKNGLIVPPKNAKAFQKAMTESLNNKELYEYLQLNSRTLIISRYQRQEVWKALLNEYNNLLKTKNL